MSNTDNTEETQVDSNQAMKQELLDMEFGALRKRCKQAGINYDNTWTREQLVNEYLNMATAGSVYTAIDLDSPIKPGYVRIQIASGDFGLQAGSVHGGGMLGQIESPAQFMVNGAYYTIARNVPVDIPNYILPAIKSVRSIQFGKTEDGEWQQSDRPTYSFQVIGHGPPADIKDRNARDGNSRYLRHKMEYLRKNGRFPTDKDLKMASLEAVNPALADLSGI